MASRSAKKPEKAADKGKAKATPPAPVKPKVETSETSRPSVDKPPVKPEAKPEPTEQVYLVDIPGSLIGERCVAAFSPDEAGKKYEAVTGSHRHLVPLSIDLLPDIDPKNLPEGVTLYG